MRFNATLSIEKVKINNIKTLCLCVCVKPADCKVCAVRLNIYSDTS